MKKLKVKEQLKQYCERIGSQNKAANTLSGVSSATITQVLNEKWNLISEEMWQRIANQIGYKESEWQIATTGQFQDISAFLSECQTNALTMSLISPAGTGKTATCKQYQSEHRNVFYLECSEMWNKRNFLQELSRKVGIDINGMTNYDMINKVIDTLKTIESPLIILDEADKLKDNVLYFFITLYNGLTGSCGMVMIATNYLEKRLQNGVRLNKKGYNEIWSRVGRRCIPVMGVTAGDIAVICQSNGITDNKVIDKIIASSESDYRRVERQIHALKQLKTQQNENN